MVTICGPDLAILDGTAKEMADAGLGEVRTIVADVTDEEQVKAAVDHASIDGALDIALANAGIGDARRDPPPHRSASGWPGSA